ncbi:MAG: AAA family ATPase [Candidatus Kapaibacteriota bacterium]
MENKFINRKELFNEFSEKLNLLKNNNEGSLILIDGGKGFGKTRILKELEIISEKQNLINATVKVEQPLNNFALSNLNPFGPFSSAIKELSTRKNIPPTKRLALSVGMTLLSGLPLAGDIFYVIKELNKDLREFGENKKKAQANSIDTYIEIFKQYSDKNPFVLFFDDFELADPQSYDLLKLILQKMKDLKAIFVIAFDSSNCERRNLAFSMFLKYINEHPQGTFYYKIPTFDKNEISQMVSNYFPNINFKEEFINWIFQKTYGVPLAITEYLKYFKANKISISEVDFSRIDTFIPSSLQSLFLSSMDKLTEEEKNILSICAAEGLEFSVYIVSQLLNLDYLSTIKTLRAIQNKTGFIQSIGAKERYGIKTTCYIFNQAIYQNYFENLLEYEEYKALHTIIADILKKSYESMDNPALKNELMPFIIAHSTLSEDEENIKEILQEQAKIAMEYDDKSYTTGIIQYLQSLNKDAEGSTEHSVISSSQDEHQRQNNNDFYDLFDFISNNNQNSIRDHSSTNSFANINEETIMPNYQNLKFDDIIEMGLNQDNESAIKILEQFTNSSIDFTDRIKANLLLAKLYSESGNLEKAIKLMDSLEHKIDEREPREIDVLYLNTISIIQYQKGDYTNAIDLLKKASEISLKLDLNYKLLTLSNISILLKELDYKLAESYKESVEKIARDLNYDVFLEDFNQRFSA